MIAKEAQMILAAGAAVIVLGLLVKREGQNAVAAGANAINPTNPQNIFARGVNAVVDILDNGQRDDSETLGTWLWGVFNKDPDFNEKRKIGDI